LIGFAYSNVMKHNPQIMEIGMSMEAPDYLRALLASGMTQAVIAQRTSIPQPTISRIARGKVKDVPSRRGRKLEALWELELGGSEPKVVSKLPTTLPGVGGAKSVPTAEGA
jgi:hypothetical protein